MKSHGHTDHFCLWYLSFELALMPLDINRALLTKATWICVKQYFVLKAQSVLGALH